MSDTVTDLGQRSDEPAPVTARRRGRPRLALGERYASPGLGAQPVERAALHAKAAERLRQMIVQGALPPGAAIGEAGLCAALGVSRTPLREALKLLAAEGLVELRASRTARVAPIRPEETDDLFEAIACIERCAAELAAARADADQLGLLSSLQERIERHHDRGELAAYFELNQQIHLEVVAAGGNAALAAAHQALIVRAERARLFALSSSYARWDESVAEHRGLLAALAARDGERAGRLLERHVRRTGEAVRDALQKAAANPGTEKMEP
jgi:DNA-binding GntR family transcriptional regulator